MGESLETEEFVMELIFGLLCMNLTQCEACYMDDTDTNTTITVVSSNYDISTLEALKGFLQSQDMLSTLYESDYAGLYSDDEQKVFSLVIDGDLETASFPLWVSCFAHRVECKVLTQFFIEWWMYYTTKWDRTPVRLIETYKLTDTILCPVRDGEKTEVNVI